MATDGAISGGATPINGGSDQNGQAVQFGTATQASNATCLSSVPVAPVTGYTNVDCEDFESGLGIFSPYTGGGGSTTVGPGRVPSQCSVSGSILMEIQTSTGATCGGSTTMSHLYGLWEVKMRVFSYGATGSEPHPVLLLWPTTNVWADGEIDFFETNIGGQAGAYLHCVGNPSQNCYVAPLNSVDYAQYHIYSLLWTSSGMSGYIDGNLWWTSNATTFMPSVAMRLDMQLDNLSGKTPVNPGEMDIDWAHLFTAQ